MTDDKNGDKRAPRDEEEEREAEDRETEDRDEDEREDRRFEDDHLFDEAEFEAEGWSIPRDPDSVARVLRSLEGLVPDILKRSAAAVDGEAEGEAAEGLRARLSDRKLPKEAVSFILGQVDTTKREFLRILSREIRLFLEDMDLGGEVAKILTSLSFEVKMEVRFIPNDQAFKPKARGSMRLKRNPNEDEEADDQPEDRDDLEAGGADSKRRRWSLRRRSDEPQESEDDADASKG